MCVYVYRIHMYCMHVYVEVFVVSTVIRVVLIAQVMYLFFIRFVRFGINNRLPSADESTFSDI